jgi:ABC-type glycerol-3-phosphate transport system substrate-binding protein
MRALAMAGRPWRRPARTTRRGLGGAALPGAAGVLAALAACGPGGAGGTGDGGTRAPAPARIVWSTFRGAAENGRWRQLQIERFQQRFPQTRVELQPLTRDYPKQYTLAAAGSLGDVYAWDPSHWVFQQAIRRGLLRPIDEYVRRDKLDLGQFYKQFVEIQRADGKLYGLPSWGWTGQDGFLFNVALFEQAGVPVPDYRSPQWTQTALYDTVVKLNTYLSAGNGFGASTTLPGFIGLTILCRAFDGDNLSPDGKRSLLLESGAREGLRWLYDLAHKERAVAVPGRFEGDLFLNGKLGLEMAGSLSVFNRNKQNKDGQLKFRAGLFPKRKDGRRPNWLGGGTWNVGTATAGATSPDAAWELIKLITDREGVLAINTVGGEGALVRPDIMADPYFQDANFRVYLDNFENPMPHVVPANSRGVEYERAVTDGGTPWYRGDVGFEDGLRTWNQGIQQALDLPLE